MPADILQLLTINSVKLFQKKENKENVLTNKNQTRKEMIGGALWVEVD